MSRLKLYWPEEAAGQAVETIDRPTLRFADYTPPYRRQVALSAVERARAIHRNSHCPLCRHPVIEPVELDDALSNRNNMPIPGTATLVGFHCTRCEYEWPA